MRQALGFGSLVLLVSCFLVSLPDNLSFGGADRKTWAFLALASVSLGLRSMLVARWIRTRRMLNQDRRNVSPLMRRISIGHLRVAWILAIDGANYVILAAFGLLLAHNAGKAVLDWYGWYLYATFMGIPFTIGLLAYLDLRLDATMDDKGV